MYQTYMCMSTECKPFLPIDISFSCETHDIISNGLKNTLHLPVFIQMSYKYLASISLIGDPEVKPHSVINILCTSKVINKTSQWQYRCTANTIPQGI